MEETKPLPKYAEYLIVTLIYVMLGLAIIGNIMMEIRFYRNPEQTSIPFIW